MKPGDIRMLLSESTGIQTQQTSAISGNAMIKIQGLDGNTPKFSVTVFPFFPELLPVSECYRLRPLT